MPTVRDVGRHAKCSPATVSRAINNTAPVSDEVRRNVLEAMRKLGYAPRPQRPRNGHASSVGSPVSGIASVVLYRHADMERLLIRDGDVLLRHAEHVPPQGILSKTLRLSVDFYMHIISGVVEELSAHGVDSSLRIVDDLESPALIAELGQPDRCGAILLGESGGVLEPLLAACPRPLVLVDILHPFWPDVVTTDNDAGIGLAVDHLVALGHRRIGFVGCSENPSYQERRAAFEHRIITLGLTCRPEWRYDGRQRIEDAIEGVLPMLRAGNRPSAIVCVADFLAIGVLRAARRCGLAVPQELSVVGFDDIDAASLMEPPLTTVRVPVHEMGRRAARQLLQAVQFGAPPHDVGCTLRLHPTLVQRASTQAVDGRA